MLRKIPFDDKAVNMLITCVVSSAEPQVQYGMADLLYEVVAGHQEDLHSKARSVITALLTSQQVLSEPTCRNMVRFLFLQLANTINPQKQFLLFEELTTSLN